MKNYNEIYGQLCSKLITDRENTVFEMTQSAARYVSTIKFTVKDPEVTRGRWQEIRYSKRNGYAYIVKYGKRLYLHKFLRIY